MPATLTADGPRLRFLVVDECRDQAETLATLLGCLGFEAEFALDGPSALEKAGDFAPDVVLLDLGMPGMSGYEVAARLRGRRAPRPPILIAATGRAEEEGRGAPAPGFHLHLPRPVESAALLNALGRVRGAVARAAVTGGGGPCLASPGRVAASTPWGSS
jgi:CheY-like chemotaxis protein